MAQDIRDLFQKDPERPEEPEKGHQIRFEAKLDQAFPKDEKIKENTAKDLMYKIAAVLVIVIGVGFFYYFSGEGFTGNTVVGTDTPEKEQTEEVVPDNENYQFSEVSPAFKKIENYYMANLNVELAKLEVSEENKELLDAFMGQLAELDREYQRLNREIGKDGLTPSSVEALIANLQLRLDLLSQLKKKLEEMNQTKNRNYENIKA